MNKKRTLATVIVLAVLCLLIYFQVRTWRRFDWAAFWNETHHIHWIGIAGGIGFTYLTVYLRAVRWRIFLKPIRKTTATALLGPQFVGFTALALLGRAGEVVRPYLIAKKENVTLTSQLGVWTVERIFDMGAFAVMLSLSFLSPDLRSLAFYGRLRLAAVALLVLIAGLVSWRSGAASGGREDRQFPGQPFRQLRSPICSSLAREATCVQRGFADHSRCKLGGATDCDLHRYLGGRRAGLHLDYACLSVADWRSQFAADHHSDGIEHGGLAAAVAGGRGRITVGGNQHVACGLRSERGAVSELRHADLGVHLYVGHSSRAGAGTPGATLVARCSCGGEEGRSGVSGMTSICRYCALFAS